MKKITVNKNGAKLWVYEKKQQPVCRGLPAVVWIHGGGWRRCGPDSLGDGYEFYRKKGFAAFGIEYSLIPEHTQDYSGKYIRRCLDDCIDCILYIKENAEKLGINPEKITVIGESAGGQLALAFATDVVKQINPKALPNACIAYNPVTSIVGKWAKCVSTVETDINNEQFYGRYKVLHSLSPAENVIKSEIPLLLLSGLNDDVVYAGDVINFYEAYKALGNETELKLYPNTTHAFALPDYYQGGMESRNKSLLTSYDFLLKHGMC